MDNATQSRVPPAHPLLAELLEKRFWRGLIGVSGYAGPTENGAFRLYQDLSLGRFLELPVDSIVRYQDLPESPDGEVLVFFDRDAEFRYVQTARLKASEVVAMVATAGLPEQVSSCGCGEGQATQSISRQNQGPDVSICDWSCTERLRLCSASGGAWKHFWCWVSYGSCRLGCLPPIVIAT